MKVQCPKCTRTLAIADEFAGRRVKCPGCQEVFRTPASEGVALAPVLNAVPADVPAVRPPDGPPSDAVQQVAAPPRPSRPVAASRRAAEGAGGGCYIFLRQDEVDLNQAIEKRMRKLLETEQLDIPIMDEYDHPPDDLGPDDLVISGRVTRCDYGSQAMRYLLGFVAMFGPGSSQLEVDAEVETAEGEKRIRARSRLWAGIFGGGNAGLMKRNVQIIANRIATGAARHATGRRFLNAHAYSCANWSLGLGIVSLLPFVGVVFGLVGLVLGLVALATVKRRGLPRKGGVALAGVLLPVLGFLVTAGVVVLIANS